jgi:hypothetical protein
MFIKDLEKIIKDNKDISSTFLRVLLKKTLIVYVLEYIYNSKEYNNLIFKGGTCLSLCYSLPRLSEDIDLDYIDNIDILKLKEDLLIFFERDLFYNKLNISITNRGKTLTLKFPILHFLGLANKSESDFLYVKIDIQKSTDDNPDIDLIPYKNFVIRSYTLPILFSGKINAIFTRKKFTGRENVESIKGRDYFDLLWFLKNGIKPDLSFFKNINGELEFKVMLDNKVLSTFTKHKLGIINDLYPFIESSDEINTFADTFIDLYEKLSLSIFNYKDENDILRNSILDQMKNIIINSNYSRDKEINDILDDIKNYSSGYSFRDFLYKYNYIKKNI